MKHGQILLIPVWTPGARVEVIQSGMEGHVVSPMGKDSDVYYVQLERDTGEGIYSRNLVQVHATGLRAVLNTDLA